MNHEQRQVLKFHKKFGFTINTVPTLIPRELGEIRHKLTLDEMGELQEAIDYGSLVEIADALGDVLYFIYGTATAYGIDMAPIFEEIHRSNMTKSIPTEGGDKKAVKGKGYQKPRLEPILEYQIKYGPHQTTF